ncbi:hypothetical protein FQZ97_972280 [compost metagenome]
MKNTKGVKPNSHMLAKTPTKRSVATRALKPLSQTRRSVPVITPRYKPPIQRKATLMAMICTASTTSSTGSSVALSQRVAIASDSNHKAPPPITAMPANIRLRARNSCR